MKDQAIVSVTKISRSINMLGYILDANIIQKIDDISKQTLSVRENDHQTEIVYSFTSKTGGLMKFDSIENFLSYINSECVGYLSISLQYLDLGEAGINIEFSHKGKVELSAFSGAPDFQFNIDSLIREIQKCEEEYNWFIRKFILNKDLSGILLNIIIGFSLLLLVSIGYYFYALQVGVNIDPSVIPNGNEYYYQVEKAIKSEDINDKLNVLLIAQLKSFINVQNILQRQQQLNTILLISLAILLVLYFLSKYVSNLYPPAIFDFEPQRQTLTEIYHKRDIFWVSVIIGFIVNIVAGLLITLVK